MYGIGNELGNRIEGDYSHDTLKGKAGNDILTSSAGNDTLVGGGGSDVLTGVLVLISFTSWQVTRCRSDYRFLSSRRHNWHCYSFWLNVANAGLTVGAQLPQISSASVLVQVMQAIALSITALRRFVL
jgi:Ca2+-binding RTX toxin-like protein